MSNLYGEGFGLDNAVPIYPGVATPPAVLSDYPNIKTYIDLFCGIGGFHIAASNLNLECVFASDIDAEARRAYKGNFGIQPSGDITEIASDDIPDHDLLCAGFPCQPFSIIGSRKGLKDPRGKLYKEIIRIIEAKRPEALLLENVKQFSTIQRGRVLEYIESDITRLGYRVESKVLNALDFGLPQKRERVLIIGTRQDIGDFEWPNEGIKMRPLKEILEKNPDKKHFASDYIRESRKRAHTPKLKPAIWHENKGGNISSHPYSCALRAGASYNYLLVDGERRLTPREMLRLQGFPDWFEILCNDSQTRKQAGNAVPVPMVQAVLEKLLQAYERD